MVQVNLLKFIEINQSKFDVRWPLNPLNAVIDMLGGPAVSSFVKIKRQNTMQGLSWVTNDMVANSKCRNDENYVKASLTAFPNPPKSIRMLMGNEDIKPGECLLVDFSFFHRQSTSKATKILSKGKFIGVLLGVDYTSCFPYGIPCKNQKK